jgi:hypothetical protein
MTHPAAKHTTDYDHVCQHASRQHTTNHSPLSPLRPTRLLLQTGVYVPCPAQHSASPPAGLGAHAAAAAEQPGGCCGTPRSAQSTCLCNTRQVHTNTHILRWRIPCHCVAVSGWQQITDIKEPRELQRERGEVRGLPRAQSFVQYARRSG